MQKKIKIAITQNFGFSAEQIKRLKKIGNVKFYDSNPQSPEEWLERVKGADVICSEEFGLKENLNNLKNVFISYPFVALGGIDENILKKNEVILANSPGCNKEAVSEWIINMILNLMRKFTEYVRNDNFSFENISETPLSLKNKNITILGKGNVGVKVGELCCAFGMNVEYFTKKDNLIDKVRKADIIVNCLSSNKSTENILDRKFFFSLKKGSYFITITKKEIYDSDAMIKALKKGILRGVADDCGGERVGDANSNYYKKLLKYKHILATPHIAWNSDISIYNGNDMAIKNIEAYLSGNPINLVLK